MCRLSKDGTLVTPTEYEADMKVLETKYSIYLDMADTQIRYRRKIEAQLSSDNEITRGI